MGELKIRGNRGVNVPRYQPADRTEKTSGTSRGLVETKGFTVSETLRKLMTRVGQAENQTRESHRVLQTGEVALAEVRENLDRMAELARESAGEGTPDRAALQEELERLGKEIGRMLSSASAGDVRLFLDGDAGLEGGAPLYALLGEEASGQEGTLPDWLLNAVTEEDLTPEKLLEALGLDKTATGAELLAAVMNGSLESDSAVGYLAALYLGAVITGGGAVEAVDLKQAMEGLRQLLEKVAEGVPPDRAVELLTNGEFTSLEDFQGRFTGGALPGLQEFLTDLLLNEGGNPLMNGSSLLTLLAGTEGVKLDLMMGLLEALQSSGAGPAALSVEGGLENGPAAEGGTAHPPLLTEARGPVQAAGRDLSGVVFDPDSGVLTVSGKADVTLRGTEQPLRGIWITGSGTVTLQNVKAEVLTVSAAGARVFSAGEAALGEVRLEEGSSLTLDGGGLIRLGKVTAGSSGTLRLTGGVAVTAEEPLPLPVLVDGPVSLAAPGGQVSSFGGKPLDPFDLIWKTFLPGWSGVTALSVNGRQARMLLDPSVPARLWLDRGDPNQGSPVYTLLIRGRDGRNHPRTRYAYLHWNQWIETFEEISMYPNPFTVTGGEAGQDWLYEEETHTLRILSNQVTAISGGPGTDGNREPFSGRIALSDGIGPVELALDGVACQVTWGGAFYLGRDNAVTLLLPNGTGNLFESGEGFAGIALGDGTTLCIDRGEPPSGGVPDGTLAASGSGGGAGIGRDSESGRDRTSEILIRGCVITARGSGGGSGIGAGKHGFMGPVTMLGGRVDATGEKGGAGIGGGLGAPVGDIHIHGGTVTAAATGHAAAIGAGVQGGCGDILIDGTARIRRARGGNPGADIGACLFGGCGKVQVSGAADIGGAKLRTQSGVSLQMGEDVVTLPQFRLSARALGLHKLSVATREEARAAGRTLEADCLWVSRIQEAYGALYTRLERSQSGLRGVYQYVSVTEGLVRDTAAAGSLLWDTSQSIPRSAAQAMRTHGRRGMEDVERLLR